MGRGYSATRAGSSRVDRKTKRTRSVSVAKLSQALADAQAGELRDDDSVASEDDHQRVSDPLVLTKYKTAGQITDEVLHLVCSACIEGANTFDLCEMGNKGMAKRLGQVFRHTKNEDGTKVKKGISYPTTVSVNQVLCNHCPLNSSEGLVLKNGDVVKVHLGCHVDGFPTQAAHTVLVGSVLTSQRNADCLQAATVAAHAMTHLLRPGTSNGTITDAIAHVGHYYGVEACEGVLSNRTKRWIADGSEAIIGRRIVKEQPQQDVAPVTISEFQVWTLDVAFTTAPTYKLQVSDEPENLFRKNEIEDNSRIDSANYLLGEIRKKFFCFPFTPCQTSEPLKAKLGVRAIVPLGMLDTFPALRCKPNFVTSRCCLTVAVSNKRIQVLSGNPEGLDVNSAMCIRPLPQTLEEVLTMPLAFGKKVGAKKGVSTAEETEEGDETPQKAPEEKAERPAKRQRRAK